MRDYFREGYESLGSPDTTRPTDLKQLMFWNAGRDKAKLEKFAQTYGAVKTELTVADIEKMRKTVETLSESLRKVNEAYPTLQQVSKAFAKSLNVNLSSLILPKASHTLWETPEWCMPEHEKPVWPKDLPQPRAKTQKFKKRKKWKS